MSQRPFSIDRKGNIHLHATGDYQTSERRFPGAYGSAMLYYMAHRVILFRAEHTTCTFVDQVDFITAPGRTPVSVYREGGPTLVVTPKAVLTWDREAKEWMLEATHPCFFIEGGKVKYRILPKKLALLEGNPHRPRTPSVEDGGGGRVDAHLSCLRPEENSLRLILKLRKMLFHTNQLLPGQLTFSPFNINKLCVRKGDAKIP